MKNLIFFFVLISFLAACDKEETLPEKISVQRIFVGSTELSLSGPATEGVPTDKSISLIFSDKLSSATSLQSIQLKSNGAEVDTDVNVLPDQKTLVIFPVGLLKSSTLYTLEIPDGLEGESGGEILPQQISFKTVVGELKINTFKIGNENALSADRFLDAPLDLEMTVNFSGPVKHSTLDQGITLSGPGQPELQIALSQDQQTATITSTVPLQYLSKYVVTFSGSLQGVSGESLTEFDREFYTAVDETPKLPVVSDEQLLTTVQQITFRYFWDFAHPVSGMARERNTSPNTITTGGSGFGIMALIVGMERNFISRDEGLVRMDKILDFLESSERFHGAWPHWLDGNTGDVIPFSTNDNGGDLVETSYLIQGLLAFRQYLEESVPDELLLIDRINALWEAVEWDWYRRANENVLYWHWSPTVDWAMNHPVRGWNECLITYVLAASSPAHQIPKQVYDAGWARNGAMKNGNAYEGITLPLGEDHGGPVFFAHYSFLGIDPTRVQDNYANYLEQNVNHTRINYAYCVRNPKNFVGYSDQCWGLTASDNHVGYAAHSPLNDLGVISPTAALSSFPYTPVESMKALKFFYYGMGDRLWGEYGFYDAFNITESWTADSFLAIDQGPIIIMIENHRTGLLWELLMSAPEIQEGLSDLGFTITN